MSSPSQSVADSRSSSSAGDRQEEEQEGLLSGEGILENWQHHNLIPLTKWIFEDTRFHLTIKKLQNIILDAGTGTPEFEYTSILPEPACIFGGYCHTTLRHDKAARAFFQYWNDGMGHRQVCYQNKNFHPESFEERTLLPTDMDVFLADPAVFPEIIARFKEHCHLKKIERPSGVQLDSYVWNPWFQMNFTVKRVCLELVVSEKTTTSRNRRYNGKEVYYMDKVQTMKKTRKFWVDFVYKIPNPNPNPPMEPEPFKGKGKGRYINRNFVPEPWDGVKTTIDDGPWKYVPDCVTNMMQMSKRGFRTAFDTKCPIRNARILTQLVTLIEKKVTFLASVSKETWEVPSDLEKTAFEKSLAFNGTVATSWNGEEAVLMSPASFRGDYLVPYRTTYRLQTLKRMKKMVKAGWDLIGYGVRNEDTRTPGHLVHNSSAIHERFDMIKITDISEIETRLNNEKQCSISLEDFKVGDVCVRLLSSYMKFEAFIRYLESSQEFYADGALKCPVSNQCVCIHSIEPRDQIFHTEETAMRLEQVCSNITQMKNFGALLACSGDNGLVAD